MRSVIKKYFGLHVDLEFSLQIFKKISSKNFVKIRPVGTEMSHAHRGDIRPIGTELFQAVRRDWLTDRQTDMTQFVVAFSSFAKRPNH